MLPAFRKFSRSHRKEVVKLTKENGGSRLHKYMIVLCVFLACMTPRYISTFKIHVGMSISFFTIFTLLSWLLFCRKIVIYKSVESYIFVAWLLLAIIGIVQSRNIGDWLYNFVWIVTAFFFSQLLYKEKGNVWYDRIVYAIVLGLIIHLIIGFYEITFHQHLFHTGNYGVKFYGTTPISIFHNPNDYATFVATIIPFVIYQLKKSSSRITRILWAFVGIISIYLLIRTGSRAAFYSLIPAALVISYIICKRSNINRVYFITAGVLFIALVLISSRVQETLLSQIVSNSIDLSLYGDMHRVNLIKNGVEFLKQTYGFGIGAGNMKYWIQNKSIYYVSGLIYFHNWYMELLVTYGIGFFVLYSYFHCKVLKKLVKASVNSNNSQNNLSTAFLISFVTFSVVCISSSSNSYSEWVWMYYAVIASYCLYL